MTDTAKPTPGPWDGAAFSDKDWVIYSTDENQKFDICHFFGDDRHVDEVEANAMLLLEAAEAFNETNLTPRQLLERVRELEAEKQDMLSVLQNIGVYGCGMLSQPAAMNAPEESWLRMRIQEMEFVAREAFFKYRGQEAALAKHGEVK